jgi:hypothetical protein
MNRKMVSPCRSAGNQDIIWLQPAPYVVQHGLPGRLCHGFGFVAASGTDHGDAPL